MWNLDLKDKCIRKFVYDLILHTHIWGKGEREREEREREEKKRGKGELAEVTIGR
jgi:hypothetical protein